MLKVDLILLICATDDASKLFALACIVGCLIEKEEERMTPILQCSSTLQVLIDCLVAQEILLDVFSLFHRLFLNITELKIFGRHQVSNPGQLA